MAFGYFRRHLPGDAHDNGHNYGYLYSSNNSSYEYIVQFLTTGHHIQYVKVSNFLTLWPCVSRITPEMKKKYKNIYICMSTTYVDVTRSRQSKIQTLNSMLTDTRNVHIGIHSGHEHKSCHLCRELASSHILSLVLDLLCLTLKKE